MFMPVIPEVLIGKYAKAHVSYMAVSAPNF